MTPDDGSVVQNRSGQQTVHWVIAALLAVIAFVLVFRSETPAWENPAFGQVPRLGAAGVFLYPIQINSNRYGLALLDVDAGTICVYEFAASEKSPKDSRVPYRLELMAARTYIYDVQLRDLNTGNRDGGGTGVQDIKRLVEEMAQSRYNQENGPVAE
jgi:hypothetical protein